MSHETLVQQFDVMSNAPNGVAKLRELILQLAVRGKLLPQEPAGEGPIPTDLPAGWSWTTLGSVGTVNPRNSAADDLVVGFCPMALLPEVHGQSLEFEERLWREVKKGYTHFADGDVVVAKITPCFQNGKAAVIRGLPSGVGAGTTELHVLRLNSELVVPEYLLVFLRSPGFVERGVATMTGTAGQQRVSREYFTQALLPLPPLAEQHRIVAKVDELMTLCDELEARKQRRTEARARLNRSVLHHLSAATGDADLAAHWRRLRENFGLLYDTPEAVVDLRQAVVELGVRGKLVPQDPAEGTARVVLERIASQKHRPSPQGRRAETSAVALDAVDDAPFAIPDRWEWARFGDLTLSIEAGWSPSCEPRPRRHDEWGVLKISAVSWGEFDPDENKALPADLDPRPQYEVRVGDFLMSRANTAELVGRSVVVSEAPPRLLLSDKVLRVRIPEAVDANYLNLFNATAAARAYYAGQASGTSSSMRNLSREQIQMLPVAVPPLAEQRRIVERVRELTTMCDRLQTQLARAREQAGTLAAAVVSHISAA